MKLRASIPSLLLPALALSGGMLVASGEKSVDPVRRANALASSPGSFRFVVVGDTQDDGTTGGGINDNMWPQMANDMNALSPSFALFCGDLISGSGTMSTTLAQWQDWDTATAGLVCPRFMTPGNHDMYSGSGSFSAWASQFPWLPTSNSPTGEEGCTYWFDVGNTRIISIATDFETGGGAPNQAWLDGVLAQSGNMENIFVFTHRPVMFNQTEPCGNTAGPFWQSLVQNDVTGFFSGHWHRYQPDRLGNGGGTWETVIGTGGGWQGFDPIRPYQQIPGFLLVEVDGLDVTGTFFADSDGDGNFDDPVDSYTMRSSTPLPVGLVAEYTFDENDASDTAPAPLGKGIDGALLDGATVGSGLSGPGGLHLDGAEDCVEAGAIGDYNMSIKGDLTLSVFGEFNSLASGDWDNPLLSYGTGDWYGDEEESNFSWWLSLQSDGTLLGFWEYETGLNVTVFSTVPGPVAAGETHHYAMTRDAAAMEARFFVDGVQLGDAVSFSRLPTGGGRGMAYIGADAIAWQGSESEWDGILDDVRIHNRVLSNTEIAQMAKPRPSFAVSNLVAGATLTLSFSGCAPNGSVLPAYSLMGGGPLSSPWGSVSLTPPIKQLPSLSVAPDGTSGVNLQVPPGTTGLEVWMQALDIGGQVLSNPLARTIG
jgi:hypothetical protein